MGDLGLVTVGCDIGQQVDPTAIAVVQFVADRYLCRDIGRLPIGTSYPNVARRVAGVTQELRRRQYAPWVIADATGVGRPVVDLLRGADVPVTGTVFTHGDRFDGVRFATEWKCGKAFLVSHLQVLLQLELLRLPVTPETLALKDELLNYEIKVDADANDKYGAFKVGTHDDLVTALGLACLVGADIVESTEVYAMPRVRLS